jgi:tRNA C32,U32 (ribose-2'-O)-methylase TrmJ
MVRNMRAMILRSHLSDQEVRTIRGMIVALVRDKYRGKA